MTVAAAAAEEAIQQQNALFSDDELEDEIDEQMLGEELSVDDMVSWSVRREQAQRQRERSTREADGGGHA